jgi:N6-L-threonylcarbamoyladenine synthase
LVPSGVTPPPIISAIDPVTTTEGRSGLSVACAKRGVRVHYPELHLCTDNGAMIAMAAAMRLQTRPMLAQKNYSFDVKPRWPLADLSYQVVA